MTIKNLNNKKSPKNKVYNRSHTNCFKSNFNSCLEEELFHSCNTIIMSACDHNDSQRHLTFHLNKTNGFVAPKTIKMVDGIWVEVKEGEKSC